MRNLITAQEVIELAFAENSNMREESISATSIHIAEIKYIRPAFGNMYALLSDKYADFTNDYVKPALAYFVKCEIVSSIAIDMSNSGIAVANPQYQSAASDKQRQRLYDSEMSKAKALLDFALEYIAAHSSEFPDFQGNAPKKHHRVGGLILGDGPSVKTSSIAGEAYKGEINKLEERIDDLEERIDDIGSGGGNSDNNYTDADKALVQTIPNKVDYDTFNASQEYLERSIESLGEHISEVGEQIGETKADKNGYYPDMSVGMADNLVGRGDTQEAYINFRPSAGADNIGDGAARIKAIRGNSVVWNQHCNYTKINSTTKNGVTFVNNGDGSFIVYTEYSGATANTALSIGTVTGVAGHTLIMLGCPDGCSSTTYYLNDSWSGRTIVKDIIYSKPNSTNAADCRITIVAGTIISEPIIFRPCFLDLTQMFGAGNEPTTVEKYYQRKPMNIEDEYAYNAGTLVDMHANEITSTSDNAYDYTKRYARVMGGEPYTFTVDNRNDITEEVYFSETLPVTTFEENIIYPNADGTYTFPSNGYANASFQGYEVGREDSICICLKHSYDKPHPAHQQEVKDLSFIGEAFPEGMRSAGSVFDEIRFNPTKKVWEKIVRVGVRAYAEGDAEDSSVTTDGKTTNYPLDNPTPTTIDLSPNFNLDYFAWDFGTEEAIAYDGNYEAGAPSAPFRAEINYEPNAVDDLRWAVSEIRKLKEQLAQVSQTTNIE